MIVQLLNQSPVALAPVVDRDRTNQRADGMYRTDTESSTDPPAVPPALPTSGGSRHFVWGGGHEAPRSSAEGARIDRARLGVGPFIKKWRVLVDSDV